ncbi:hypothetical protein ACFQY0_07720 [Haloferula chungangensis]|uniref:Uncharacterized protein n=1 Tax=Haloferula chungangensis TaxID=1048331 RepID=A0ABW2L670_9BACT
MKSLIVLAALLGPLAATTISVVPVFEPVSLHETDVDEVITDTGEALQATVISRPMALTGAFPETLIESIRTPHKLPSNNPNYTVEEANLLVLCNIGIAAEVTEEGLVVKFDVAELSIPDGVDLTIRQVLKLGMVAVRKTLEYYQAPQSDPLIVRIRIVGTNEGTASLTELDSQFALEGD